MIFFGKKLPLNKLLSNLALRSYSGLAQLVEQRTVNPLVVGSSPTSGVFLCLRIRQANFLRLCQSLRYPHRRLGFL